MTAVVLQTSIEGVVDAVPLQVWQLLLLAGFAGSLWVLYRIARPRGAWARRLRSRLLLGLPWGTVGGMALVVCVYLFLQGGLVDLHRPVTYAFQATGFSNPLGLLTAAFAHQNFGHLFGNLAGALVFGWIAEYGYSHYATERGHTAFATLRTNPYARAGAFFLGIVGFGLLMGVFSWGPIIGFSGVVYGLAGFALVVRPLPAIVAILVNEVGLVGLLYNAINNPVSRVGASAGRSDPWFAGIAVQGHFFGFLLGALLAALLLRRREGTPDAGRIWLGVLLFGVGKGLWTAYWPVNSDSYLLFRALGVVLVATVTAVVVASVGGSDRPVAQRLFDGERRLTRRNVAAGVIVVTLVFMAMVGAFANVATIQSADLPNDPVEIEDYQVGYVENTTNQQYSVVGLSDVQLSQVEASGVIVASAERNVWQVTHSKGDLAFRNYARVLVGGVGWRQEVLVTRTGWTVVGDRTTYWVRLHTDGVRRTVYTSGRVTSEAVIANRTISMRTTPADFEILVGRDNETIGVGQLPAAGGNVTVGGLRFERVEDRLYAVHDGTRVRIATKQQPRAERFRDR